MLEGSIHHEEIEILNMYLTQNSFKTDEVKSEELQNRQKNNYFKAITIFGDVNILRSIPTGRMRRRRNQQRSTRPEKHQEPTVLIDKEQSVL